MLMMYDALLNRGNAFCVSSSWYTIYMHTCVSPLHILRYKIQGNDVGESYSHIIDFLRLLHSRIMPKALGKRRR